MLEFFSLYKSDLKVSVGNHAHLLAGFAVVPNCPNTLENDKKIFAKSLRKRENARCKSHYSYACVR